MLEHGDQRMCQRQTKKSAPRWKTRLMRGRSELAIKEAEKRMDLGRTIKTFSFFSFVFFFRFGAHWDGFEKCEARRQMIFFLVSRGTHANRFQIG